MKKIGIVVGTFDPLTCGHEDIICRASKLVDTLYVIVSESKYKNTSLSFYDRYNLCVNLQKDNIFVSSIKDGIAIVDKAKELNANIIFKGIRNTTDYNYEHSMALVNKDINPTIETLLLISSPNYINYSSTIVRELIELQKWGTIISYVPENVYHFLYDKFAKK